MTREVTSIDGFLSVLRKSGLVEAERLKQAISPWSEASGPLPAELPRTLIDAGLITDWQMRQLRKGKHRGYFLGQYKLLRELGKGGMSSVYLAEHTAMNLPVAIKVLPLKRVDQKSYKQRFEREAHASFRLNHPNIARATNFDNQGDLYYIVLDYIEGTDLYKKVKEEGPLPVKEALDYVRQAALGLQYAHEEGLVHRDIKPANLMRDKRGTIKILDLGLALGNDDDEDGNLTKQHDEKVLGTADYLAPEQAKNSHAADPRSDIYSLGCTLFYLLVGRAPFAKGSVVERIKAHWHEPPPNPLDELDSPPPDLDSAVIDLYFRMLEKHPDARPQNAREVAATIQAWLDQHEGDAPRPAGSLRRTPGGGSDSGSSMLNSVVSSKSGLRRRSPSTAGISSSNILPSQGGDTAPMQKVRGAPTKSSNTTPIQDGDAGSDDSLLADKPTKNASQGRPEYKAEPTVDEEDDDDFLATMGSSSPQSLTTEHSEEEDDDDYLYNRGGATDTADGEDDDDDDFLSPRTAAAGDRVSQNQANVVNAGGPASGLEDNDMSVDEWWATEFLRLSLRVWFWIIIGLFITFILAITTHEVMKAYKLGPYAQLTTTSTPDRETGASNTPNDKAPTSEK